MFKMQLRYISEIFVQYFYIMMNDFQCQQFVIFWIATNKEKKAGVSIGLLDTHKIVLKGTFWRWFFVLSTQARCSGGRFDSKPL